jgi:DNA-binding IclR family transcriptional regulator
MWNMTVPRPFGSRSAAPTVETGVGVLDRTVAIIEAVGSGSRTFSDIAEATGLARSTAHRLLKALEAQGLISFDVGFGYRLGPRLVRLASAALRELPLRDLARPALERLARVTGETAQLFVRSGDERLCIDVVESESELRTIVPVGASLPLTAGSAGKVIMAWALDQERLLGLLRPFTDRTPGVDRLRRQLATAHHRGWAESSGEREPGVASVSAPVFGAAGSVLAAVSVSGPAQRLGPRPGRQYAPAVVAAARDIEAAVEASLGQGSRVEPPGTL